jgi:putative transposase
VSAPGPGRPAVLGMGDRVRFGGVVHTVIGLAGTLVRLADPAGEVSEVALPVVQATGDFALLDVRPPRPLPPAGVLDRLPAPVVQQALWWEHHILEVLQGLPPDAPPGAVARPEYDPTRWSLTRREQAKAAELTVAGHPVTASTVKHHRQRYEAQGVAGLVDHRADKRTPPFGRVDARVVAAMRAAIAEATDASSRTANYILWRSGQILAAEAKDAEEVVVPSRRTLYRLFAKLADGQHTTGSARTRRSLANRPDRPFGELPALAPGELMQIDSTPLDVLVRLDDGVVGKVELTGMIDVATRTVTAAVLRPTTKSVDASVLLARTVTPEPMRPGWVEALRMSRSVLPYQRLLSLDARLEHAAARPVMVPATIVCDHGKVFVSRNFRASCRFLGINFQPAHQGTPTDKPHIEKMLASVATLFAQFVAGYTGASPERRGRKLEQQPLWSLLELQDLLDEWLIAAWQNRPHDGLRDPAAPGRAFTPNERYTMLVEAAGYVPVALSADDYVELLPARWHAINAYGIKLRHRTYDAEALNPLRQQRSGIRERNGRWEVHYDPYDLTRIWIRDHRNGGWITAFWKHLHRVPMPFGELAWDHARSSLPAGTEAEIAEAVRSLLERAHQGPDPAGHSAKPTRRDRRVAAHTRTASPMIVPAEPTPPKPDAEEDATVAAAKPLAKVIPLGIFDAHEEAKKRW